MPTRLWFRTVENPFVLYRLFTQQFARSLRSQVASVSLRPQRDHDGLTFLLRSRSSSRRRSWIDERSCECWLRFKATFVIGRRRKVEGATGRKVIGVSSMTVFERNVNITWKILTPYSRYQRGGFLCLDVKITEWKGLWNSNQRSKENFSGKFYELLIILNQA